MAGGGVGATVNLSQLTIKDFDDIFYDSYTRTPPEYVDLLNVKTADANYFRQGQIGGFGAMYDMDEGDAITYDIIKQGNEKTIKYTNIALAVQITQNMREDDNTGLVARVPEMMGKSLLYTCELKAWDILNNGFVTTKRVGLDTKALFSASHTNVDSATTYSNLGTAASFSETVYLALCDCLENNVNERNIPCPLQPDVLWIPKDLRWVAERLQLTERKVGSMDNDVNLMGPKGGIIGPGGTGKFQFKVSHFLTSATAVFLAAKKEDHDLRFIWRRKLATKAQDDFNTESWLYKISARLTVDFFDHRGIAANAGA
jgi:hypothetical protein